MDLGLSEKQRVLQSSARAYLEQACPESLVRELEKDPAGFSSDLWAGVTEQDWTRLLVPNTHGGAGSGLMELALVVEECGRALLPSPLIATAVASVALGEASTEEQMPTHLPAICSEGRVLATAISDTFQAHPAGGGYVLNGSQGNVQHGGTARHFLARAALPDGSETLVLLDSGSRGVNFERDPSASIGARGRLELSEVDVAEEGLVRSADMAAVLRLVASAGAVLQSGYLLGLAQMASEITLRYASTRSQFGKPIASFQALQHQTADTLTDLEASRLATWRASAPFDARQADLEEASHVAKALSGESTRRILRRCMLIHGGVAFAENHSLQLYFNRQLALERVWGDTQWHRQELGQALVT